MRKGTCAQEKEKVHRWVLFNENPKTIAIRTLSLVRICIDSGLNSVKKNLVLHHGNCTNVFTRSEERTKKIRIRSSKQRLLRTGGKAITHFDHKWQNQVGNLVPVAVPRFIVEASLRSDAECTCCDASVTSRVISSFIVEQQSRSCASN